MPAIAADTDGSVLSVLASSGVITGGIYTRADGQTLTVFLRSDGLPSSAIAANTIFLFDHYTSNSVDIALLAPTGELRIARQVTSSVMLTGPTSTTVFHDVSLLKTRMQADAAASLGSLLKAVAYGVEVTGCLVSTAASIFGAPESAGLSFVIAASGCGATLADSLAHFSGSDDPQLAASREAYGKIANAYSCTATANPFDCVALAIKAVVNQLEGYEGAKQADIAQALMELAGMGKYVGSFTILGSNIVRGDCIYSVIIQASNWILTVPGELYSNGAVIEMFTLTGGSQACSSFTYVDDIGILITINGRNFSGSGSNSGILSSVTGTFSTDYRQATGTLTVNYGSHPGAQGFLSGSASGTFTLSSQ